LPGHHSKIDLLLLSRPVNLHPLFLFWKHRLVCDPEKPAFFGSMLWTWWTRIVGADWLGE
jgi:hypothetical protein